MLILFPFLPRWRQQQKSFQGDQSKTANNFLYEFISFITKVIIQDGIYWVHHFPNNEASIMLKNLILNYEVWAASARAEVKRKEAGLRTSRVDVLHEATQGAFVSINQ